MTFDSKVMKKIGEKSETLGWRARNAIKFEVSATNAWRQSLPMKVDHDLDLR